MPQDIAGLIRGDLRLQSLIKDMLNRELLLSGIFHREAYLLNDLEITELWRRRKQTTLSELEIVAIGMMLYNAFFGDISSVALSDEEPVPSAKVSRRLRQWKKFVQEHWSSDFTDLQMTSQLLGQYLEFMNRRSQGF